MFGSLVMLHSYRPRPPEAVERSMAHDVYRLVLARMLGMGLIGEAHVAALSSVDRSIEVGGVPVHMVRSFGRMPAVCRRGDVLLVRGDKMRYAPALRRGRWRVWLFYAADKRVAPTRLWGFDAVLMDDAARFDEVRRCVRGAVPMRFIKTADPQVFRPLADQQRRFDACCFGNMDRPVKNYQRLPGIVSAAADLRYVVIGRVEAGLRQRLERSGAAVHFAGYVPPAEANWLLNQSGVGLILSEHDGAPRTILESMAAGLPQVVNAALAAGRDYVTPRTGVLAPLDDFPAAVRRVLAARQVYDPAAEFAERFSPTAAAEALAEAARRALEARGPVRGPLRNYLHHLPLVCHLRSARRKAMLARYAKGQATGAHSAA